MEEGEEFEENSPNKIDFPAAIEVLSNVISKKKDNDVPWYLFFC
jgi:hypothetical protein